MTSYVFGILNKEINWVKVYKLLALKYEDFEILFAVHKNNKELELINELSDFENVKVLTFEADKSENYMISEAIKKTQGDNLVVCRDYVEYATILSDYLVAMGEMGVQVAMFRKPRKKNKVKDFFKKLWNKYIKFMFGFKLYEGDIGLIYFGNIATSILRELPNNVTFTKVNRWVGFDISYVESEDIVKANPQKLSIKSTTRNWIISLSVFALLVAGFVFLIAKGLISFIASLVLLLFIVTTGFLFGYFFAKYYIVKKFGDLD